MTPEQLKKIEADAKPGISCICDPMRGVTCALHAHLHNVDVPALLAEVNRLAAEVRRLADRLAYEEKQAAAELAEARREHEELHLTAALRHDAIQRAMALHRAIVKNLDDDDSTEITVCLIDDHERELISDEAAPVLWPCETARALVLDGSEPAYPEPGSQIPGQPGFVVGTCGHRVAGSEWRAGLRACERCPAGEGQS